MTGGRIKKLKDFIGEETFLSHMVTGFQILRLTNF